MSVRRTFDRLRQPLHSAWPHRGLAQLGMLLLMLAATGCTAPPKATAVGTALPLPFDQAVAAAADGLVAQVGQLRVPTAAPAPRTVVVDPMLDAGTGQQTAATQSLQQRVIERIAARADLFRVVPFDADNLAKAPYLLTGTLTRADGDPPGPLRRIALALTDPKTGRVVAQATALARAEGLDHTPLPYYRDSPILLKDRVLEGYVRTSATLPGQPADTFYMQRLAVAATIDRAAADYNAERYPQALAEYQTALGTPGGEQLRVVNGIYLSNTRLEHGAEAEQAFGRVVALAIRDNELGVKFLFNPGSTEFWSDAKVSAAYPMWLRQIAHEAGTAKVCMNIVGHTSRTGSEAVNEALSLQRANAIRQHLASDNPALTQRIKATGMGFRENIVGSGSDNAVDALDRRVEFRIVPCN